MKSDRPDHLPIDARVALLERQLRRNRAFAVAFLGLATLVVASGQMGPPRSIQAPSFELVDNQGRIVGAFAVSTVGMPGIWFNTVQGENGSFWVAGTDGKAVFFRGKESNGKVVVHGSFAR